MPIIVVRFCFQAYFLFESSNGSLISIFESDMGYKILRKCAALSSSSSSKLQILSKSITYLFCAPQSLSSWRCWLTQVGECCCTLFWLQDKTEQLALVLHTKWNSILLGYAFFFASVDTPTVQSRPKAASEGKKKAMGNFSKKATLSGWDSQISL